MPGTTNQSLTFTEIAQKGAMTVWEAGDNVHCCRQPIGFLKGGMMEVNSKFAYPAYLFLTTLSGTLPDGKASSEEELRREHRQIGVITAFLLVSYFSQVKWCMTARAAVPKNHVSKVAIFFHVYSHLCFHV